MAAAKTPAVPAIKRIKVRATRTGYYDHARRREGNVFAINEADFTPSWMEPVNKSTPDSLTTAQADLNAKFDEELVARRGGTGGVDSDVI